MAPFFFKKKKTHSKSPHQFSYSWARKGPENSPLTVQCLLCHTPSCSEYLVMDKERVRPTELRACSWQGITSRVLAPAFQRPVGSWGVYGPDARGVTYFQDEQRLAWLLETELGTSDQCPPVFRIASWVARICVHVHCSGLSRARCRERRSGSKSPANWDIWVTHAPSGVLTPGLRSVCVVCMYVCVFWVPGTSPVRGHGENHVLYPRGHTLRGMPWEAMVFGCSLPTCTCLCPGHMC